MGEEYLHLKPSPPRFPLPLQPRPPPSKHCETLQTSTAGKQARLAGVDGGVPGLPVCGHRLGPGLRGGPSCAGAAGPHHLSKAAAAGLHPRHHNPQASSLRVLLVFLVIPNFRGVPQPSGKQSVSIACVSFDTILKLFLGHHNSQASNLSDLLVHLLDNDTIHNLLWGMLCNMICLGLA